MMFVNHLGPITRVNQTHPKGYGGNIGDDGVMPPSNHPYVSPF